MAHGFLADLIRKQTHYVVKDSFVNKYIKVPLQFGTIAVLLYRYGRWCLSRRSPLIRTLVLLIYYILRPLVVWISRIEIKLHVRIGDGFVIHNFASIFIDADYIGDNFTINQGVSVGPDWRRKGKPRLGKDVFLGSGAKVLGDIELEDNVVVAANALVATSVKANSIVAGVPARVISYGDGKSYVKTTATHAK